MDVKLSEIDGLMPKYDECTCGKSKECVCDLAEICARNCLIDELGSKKIGLNREKLASLIYRESLRTVAQSDKLADAIIAAQRELFEVKN